MTLQRIPLGKPFIQKEEKEAVIEIIDGGRIATGDTVHVFEDEFAKKIGRKYSIMVNSGTSALWLSMKVLKLENPVIIPTVTCSAVLNAVLNAGLKPIFADVDNETHNIDLASVPERQLEEAEAVIVTHAYGHSADMDVIDHYVKEYDLTLIEDFAQATGGYFKNKMLGSFGEVSVTSFYGPKIMTTGHGGAILTDDDEVYEKCVYMRGDNVGKCYMDLIPSNLRMTDVQAAMGIIQLKKLGKMVEMRQNAARKLTEVLDELDIGLPIEKGFTKHTYYKYNILIPEDIKKWEFIERMDKSGIAVGMLYDPPLHKTEVAMNILNMSPNLPISEFLVPRTVSLPMYPELSEEEIMRIGDCARFAIKGVGI